MILVLIIVMCFCVVLFGVCGWLWLCSRLSRVGEVWLLG